MYISVKKKFISLLIVAVLVHQVERKIRMIQSSRFPLSSAARCSYSTDSIVVMPTEKLFCQDLGTLSQSFGSGRRGYRSGSISAAGDELATGFDGRGVVWYM